MRLETQILSNLIHSEEYARKVLPFLKKEYFSEITEATLLQEISKFYTEYNSNPTPEILRINVANRDDFSESLLKDSIALIDSISNREVVVKEWLLKETESFCKNRAVYNAIYDSIHIMDGKDKQSPDSIPKILADALSVSFDNHVGHDYLEDIEARYDFYHRVDERLPFDIDLLNKITEGGLPKKSLSCVISGTGGGKTLFMCHFAAASLLQGKNVLYITMEMAEERIAERIDANLLNVNIKDLKFLEQETFNTKINRVSNKTKGKLIIKEFPTGAAHAGHFRALIQELKLKRDFVPDVIVVDYLNICASQRVRMGGSVNSYTFVKLIAEEIRSLCIEFNLPILTATQANRDGIDSSDIDMTNTSESIGLPQTLDLYLALIRTEELDAVGQIMIKQLKNRYNDPNYYKRFVVGVDFGKMKLFDAEQSAQNDIVDAGKKEEDVPLFDKSINRDLNMNSFKF